MKNKINIDKEEETKTVLVPAVDKNSLESKRTEVPGFFL
jgi:hypothetical protein